MAGNNRSRKSSSFKSVFNIFFSIFNICGSKKPKGKRGYYDAYDSGRKSWASDYDKDCWGVADPGIDMKVETFIRCKNRVSESERRQLDPAAGNA